MKKVREYVVALPFTDWGVDGSSIPACEDFGIDLVESSDLVRSCTPACERPDRWGPSSMWSGTRRTTAPQKSSDQRWVVVALELLSGPSSTWIEICIVVSYDTTILVAKIESDRTLYRRHVSIAAVSLGDIVSIEYHISIG